MSVRSQSCHLAAWMLILAGAGLAQAQGPQPGDANGDGIISQLDVGVVANQILGLGQAAGNPECNGDAAVDTLDVFCILNLMPTQLVETSPENGAEAVGVERETILHFSGPLDPSTVTAAAVKATFGGQSLDARLHVSKDRKSVSLFYDPELPPSARVRVTVDGGLLRDDRGRLVDADLDFADGGVATVDFDTLTLSTVPGTTVFGRVFASELVPGPRSSINVPLQGATIEVEGTDDQLFAVTDKNGNFRLEGAPAGRFFVSINGRTATNGVPPGAYYPYVGKQWESVAGKETAMMDVFLPLIPPGTLHEVSATQATRVEFVPNVLAEHPEFAGVEVTVPADSLFADDGTRGGLAGISPVAPDRLPGPLPPGLEFPVVLTLQTNGPTNLDTPAPACFPNLPEPATGVAVAAGTKNALYSFNHDTGDWEQVGTMTVTADERLACTDPGAGILAPGWHGVGPPTVRPPPLPPAPNCSSCGRGGHGLRSKASRGSLGCGDEGVVCFDECDAEGRDKTVTRCNEDLEWGTKQCIISLVAEASSGSFFGQPRGGTIAFLACLETAICNHKICVTRAYEDSGDCGPPPPLECHVNRSISEVSGIRQDPVTEQLETLTSQIVELVHPFDIAGQSVPEQVQAQVADLVDQANAVAGGDAVAYLVNSSLQDERDLELLEAVVGPQRGTTPAGPVRYVARISRPAGRLDLRGTTGPHGRYQLFVPRDGVLQFIFFHDPESNRIAMAHPRLSPTRRYGVPRFYLQSTEALPDHDTDGLPDLVELVYGTLTYRADTDGDGVLDGAEVAQGTNPLDGLAVLTGIVATADTPGTAVGVCALNNLVAVADSGAGISVFNVFNGMSPTIIAQLDTPGSAIGVACAQDRVAVADGPAGLAIVDISDPPSAQILAQVALSGSTQAVAASGGVAYAGTSDGRLAAIDLTTGTLLQQVPVPGPVEDLAVEGENLFVLTNTQLRIYNFATQLLQLTGSLAVSGMPSTTEFGRKLFVGGGRAYVGYFTGFSIVDVTNPAMPRLLGTPPTTQLAIHDIAANGSGLLVPVTSFNQAPTLAVSLYDVSDANDVTKFLTSFLTPGDCRGIALFNGLAYVADSLAGLQVLNYLSYDAQGVAPTVSLLTNVVGGQVQEGALMRLTASVTDDVQVRNVEFLVDGNVVQTDGNFPFEMLFNAPPLSQQSSFTVAARASDTGGNRTTTPAQSYSIVADSSPPTVSNSSVAAGANVYAFAPSLSFSESMDPASLVPANVRLEWAGPDDAFGTGDDQLLGVEVSVLNQERRIVVRGSAPDPLGNLRLVLDGSKLKDRVGNLLDGDGNGTPGGDYVLSVTRDIVFGKTFNITLDPATELYSLEFDVPAPSIASIAYQSSRILNVRVLAPNGTPLVSEIGAARHALDLALNQPGSYRLELELIQAFSADILFGFSDQPLETLPPLALNTPVSSNLNAFHDVDEWPIAATAGQQLTFAVLRTAGPNSVYMRLLRASDRAVLGDTIGVGDGEIEDFPIPSTGQYLVQIFPPSYGTTATSYTLSVGTPGLDVHTIAFGQSATDTLDYGAHIIWYQFAGASGQIVTVEATTNGRHYQVFAPDQTLLHDSLAAFQRFDLALPQTGTYRFQIRANQGTTGAFTIGLSDQPIESLTPLTIDTPVTSSLSDNFDVDDWPLNATQGQVLSILADDLAAGGTCPRVRLLRGSDRAQLALGSTGCDSAINGFTVPATGAYVVQVFVFNYTIVTGSADYTLTVSD